MLVRRRWWRRHCHRTGRRRDYRTGYRRRRHRRDCRTGYRRRRRRDYRTGNRRRRRHRRDCRTGYRRRHRRDYRTGYRRRRRCRRDYYRTPRRRRWRHRRAYYRTPRRRRWRHILRECSACRQRSHRYHQFLHLFLFLPAPDSRLHHATCHQEQGYYSKLRSFRQPAPRPNAARPRVICDSRFFFRLIWALGICFGRENRRKERKERIFRFFV